MLTRSILLLSLTILSASGQPQKQAARHARFLALGDSPPFQQEIRGDVRYEIEPPPGSLPPRELTPGFGGESAASLPLALGRISAPVEVPAGEGPLVLTPAGEQAAGSPWLQIKRPESGDFLVIIWRNPAKKNWDDVLSLTVPDGPVGAPAGSVRIVNLFPQSVRVKWADEALLFVPGKALLRKLMPSVETPLQVVVPDHDGSMKRYYSGSVSQNPGERSFVIIYRADGAAPRRPLKVSVLREPARGAPKPD